MSISSRAVRTNPLHVLVALARRKGDCFVYASGPSRSFLVNRPEYARHVLVDRAADYSKDTPINAGFATTIADALLTSEGETWRHQRTLLQFTVGPMPHASVLRSIELFGTEVAPVIRRETAGRRPAVDPID